MTDEKLIEQVARDIEAVKCGLNYDYMDFCRDAARAIIPIIKAERIRGGVMVKAAAISSVATCMMGREILAIRALSVPAIVEAGEHQLKENSDASSD